MHTSRYRFRAGALATGVLEEGVTEPERRAITSVRYNLAQVEVEYNTYHINSTYFFETRNRKWCCPVVGHVVRDCDIVLYNTVTSAGTVIFRSQRAPGDLCSHVSRAYA